MSDHIPDEAFRAVEMQAVAYSELLEQWPKEDADRIVREILACALHEVAPLILAAEVRTIAKACDELASMAPSSVGMVADLLHFHADKLEREAVSDHHD